MKTQIPKFLKNEFTKGKSFTNKFPDEIKQFMIDYANYYNWGLNDNLKNIFRMMKQGISELPTCKLDGCNKKVKYSIRKKGFTETCCEAHSRKAYYLENYGVENVSQLDETKKKKVETSMRNYGVSNPSQADEIKIKKEETLLENYGVKHGFCNGEIRDRAMETTKQVCLEKYGFEYHQQSEQSKEKMKSILKQKYGVESVGAIPGNEEKKKLSNLKKYGVSNVFQLDEVKEKREESLLENYGVTHPLQNSELVSKMLSSVFRKKEYIWQTGEVSIVQGYEPIVLSELEQQGYKFQDVITDAELMPEIWYEFEGKQRRYFPDFYIPSENLIIEVKSEYTLQADFEKNEKKFEATKSLGFDFKLEVR
jgi:hypothetical protein